MHLITLFLSFNKFFHQKSNSQNNGGRSAPIRHRHYRERRTASYVSIYHYFYANERKLFSQNYIKIYTKEKMIIAKYFQFHFGSEKQDIKILVYNENTLLCSYYCNTINYVSAHFKICRK